MTSQPAKDEYVIEAGTVLGGLGADGRMELHHDALIHVRSGVIVDIFRKDQAGPNVQALTRYGGPGFIAMPGLVNGHHHFGITPLMSGVSFEPLEFWLPQFRAMRSVGPRLDTLYSAIEMLESGVTTVHHIASALSGGPQDWMDTGDAVISAYSEIGMRAGYSVMLRDQNILAYDGDGALLDRFPADVREWFISRLYPSVTDIEAYLDFHRSLAAKHADNPRVKINYAPANLHWCSDRLLEALGDAARSHGAQIHMHLVETRRQADYARKRSGKSAVRHLDDLGFLGPHTTFGHCNWLDEGDFELLASHGCCVCHNASSGLRLGSGRANVARLAERRIPVALGIDQSNVADDRDMLLEIKLAWALHRGTELFEFRPDAAVVLQQATEHGARTAGFGGVSGRLEPGHRADIVLLNRSKVERPFVDPLTPVAETVLHRARKDAVEWVFVDGRPVVENGRITTIDRDAVIAEIGNLLKAAPSQRDVEARGVMAVAMPILRQYYADTLPGA